MKKKFASLEYFVAICPITNREVVVTFMDCEIEVSQIYQDCMIGFQCERCGDNHFICLEE